MALLLLLLLLAEAEAEAEAEVAVPLLDSQNSISRWAFVHQQVGSSS
jgi:hypothetical protein